MTRMDPSDQRSGGVQSIFVGIVAFGLVGVLIGTLLALPAIPTSSRSRTAATSARISAVTSATPMFVRLSESTRRTLGCSPRRSRNLPRCSRGLRTSQPSRGGMARISRGRMSHLTRGERSIFTRPPGRMANRSRSFLQGCRGSRRRQGQVARRPNGEVER